VCANFASTLPAGAVRGTPDVTDLGHVLSIGGAAGAGKTTVARRLARRYGLRIYSSDNRTWDHRDRALISGVEAAIRFEEMPPAERLLLPIEDQLAMTLVDERGAMVLDDLRALPRSPMIIAEGTVLPAAGVDASQSVWLMPASAFQALHRLSALERHRRGLILENARRHEIKIIVVDGSRSVTEITEEAEQLFAERLGDGPLASSRQERQTLLRDANLAVVEQIRSGCARPWGTNDPETVMRSFVCECGDENCVVDPDLTVGEAAARPVVARGHSR
jgi:hypothetical protein